MKLLGKQVSIEEAKKIRENTIKKWDELGFLQGIDVNKSNLALLYEAQASCLIKEKEMNANEIKKDLYKSKNMARFSHYVSGNLYYNVQLEDGNYQFPIETVDRRQVQIVNLDENGEIKLEKITVNNLSWDLAQTTFNAEVKGSELIRWISRAIDKGEFIKVG